MEVLTCNIQLLSVAWKLASSIITSAKHAMLAILEAQELVQLSHIST